MKRIGLALALALCLTGLAFAQGSNTGTGGPPGVGDHDLTPEPFGGLSILYAPSEADDAGYRAAIAAITGGTVDYFDASAGTPSLDLLNQYDCVNTWANFAYADNVGFGNNLADYVDGGGRVALGAFTTYTQGNFLDGRIMDPGYSPVFSPTGGNWFFSSPYSGDGGTCMHDQVSSYECTFRDMLDLQGSGVQDGSYLDGEIAGAYRPDFNVIHNNGSGALQLGCTGDWARLVANACNCGGQICALNARIAPGDIRPGDALNVHVTVDHNRLTTVRKSLLIEIVDRRGNVIAGQETAPLELAFGDHFSGDYSILVPGSAAPGIYKLRISIGGMQQGRQSALRTFRVSR